MIRHERDSGNELNMDRFKLLDSMARSYDKDGLNNLKGSYHVRLLGFLLKLELIIIA